MSDKLYIGYDASGYFKIGITTDFRKRLKQFRTGNPTFQYLFLFDVEKPAVAEIELHTMFDKSRISNEWFSLSADDLKWIADRYYHEIIPMEQIKKAWKAICVDKIAVKPFFMKYMWEQNWK